MWSSEVIGRRQWLSVLLCVALLPGWLHAAESPVQLQSDTTVATAGNFRLSWEAPAGPVELQESRSPAFNESHTLYKGEDRASVMSGKADGNWYYRARSLDSPAAGVWSEIVEVRVQHHSLARALGFFSLGLLVFFATAVMIVRGGKQQ